MKKAVENEILIAKISKLLDSLNIKYNNISPYIQAFIHRSIVNERPDYAPVHNERLEFLGDAVLELIITKNLFNDFPDKPEGDLTDIRSALVRGTNLAKIAKTLGLHDFLILGKGEELGGGRENNYLLANVVEALLGAIYLDGGIEISTSFVDKHIYITLEDILHNNLTKDYKTLIQELAQGKFDVTPTYKIISESGPDHDKDFEVGVYLGEKIIGQGNGSSKKKAQEHAALNGFNKINI
ncbi:ribonuclease III [Candidatus Gracilibacteria bacterium 28_42_T64]|nr:ribonuclease III [Candidatus Gracilibacteria bacterium 28_42_T64]